ELDRLYKNATDIDFIDRKYNQIEHFLNLLGRLDDLCIHDGMIYFKTDADRLFGDEKQKKAVRDPYLQRVYKSELEEESCSYYKCKTPKCMLDGLAHPVLIASHIKPYSHCTDGSTDQFDLNNGLLLNKAFDSLFDLGYITFSDDGTIMPSYALDDDMKKYLSNFVLDKKLLNPKRIEYLKYHRDNVFEKRFSTSSKR
ncbi:MAG: HNH endonuclease, partial [Muribaculaceae bacterium]|nr:HNH endonuclease [Muribaculaceae bacterium]